MLDIRGFAGGMLATNGYVFGAPEGWIAVDAREGEVDWMKRGGVEPQLLLLGC